MSSDAELWQLDGILHVCIHSGFTISSHDLYISVETCGAGHHAPLPWLSVCASLPVYTQFQRHHTIQSCA